jgi:predicted HTH domain antitoxin
MITITLQFPEEVLATLRQSPRELAREITLAAAIDWYRRGLVSQGRAAEIAGIPRADFIDALAERKVEVVHVDFDSLDEEIERA